MPRGSRAELAAAELLEVARRRCQTPRSVSIRLVRLANVDLDRAEPDGQTLEPAPGVQGPPDLPSGFSQDRTDPFVSLLESLERLEARRRIRSGARCAAHGPILYSSIRRWILPTWTVATLSAVVALATSPASSMATGPSARASIDPQHIEEQAAVGGTRARVGVWRFMAVGFTTRAAWAIRCATGRLTSLPPAQSSYLQPAPTRFEKCRKSALRFQDPAIRAPASEAGGRAFESHPGHHFSTTYGDESGSRCGQVRSCSRIFRTRVRSGHVSG